MNRETKHTEYLDTVLDILKQNGILNIKDLDTYPHKNQSVLWNLQSVGGSMIAYTGIYNGRDYIEENGVDFARNIYDLTENYYFQTRSFFQRSENSYVVAHNSDAEAGKYMCFFLPHLLFLQKAFLFVSCLIKPQQPDIVMQYLMIS